MTPLSSCPKFRLLASFAGALLLSGGALAQTLSNDRGDLQPAPVPNYAGTYHMATGILTPPGEENLLPNPGVIYNNSCLPVGYFTGLVNGGTIIDEGRIPTANSPSPNTGVLSNYWVTKYQIAYVTRDLPGTFSIRVRFWEDYDTCTALASAGATVSDILLTGLPAAAVQGTATGWIVDIDLLGSGFEFCLRGDANGTYDGVPSLDTFGYGYTLAGQAGTTSGTSGGPFLTGGSTCGMGDATYYKNPGFASGSGLDDLNQVRRDGAGGQTSGCFLFSASGTFAYAGEWMVLTADLNNCTCPGNPDADLDGTPDGCDGCPNDPAKIAPGQCGCGFADTDTDLDGTADCIDGCPNDPNLITDVDADGDGYLACNECDDTDPAVNPGAAEICGNGIDDNCNGQQDEAVDSDGDGTNDCFDGCPNDFNKIAPGQCGCGFSDVDTDLDGTADCNDLCPNDPNLITDVDSDGDGYLDCNDGCPNDVNKIAPGQCGCGFSDLDTDLDGTADCNDGCPNDPNKVSAGQCGCGFSDVDTDLDGTADCNDGCPNDPNKVAPGACGCGIADTDNDADGVANCNDNCPNAANANQLDVDVDGVGDACDNCIDIPNPTQADCDNDATGDACAIAAGAKDCNFNGVPDSCDVASGSSPDLNANKVPDECELDGGTPFCFGSSGCPCGNNSSPSENAGCRNSSGLGGKLVGSGVTFVYPNDALVLTCSNLTGLVVVFFQGDAIASVAFGDGHRCMAHLIRIGKHKTSGGGAVYPVGADLPISLKGGVPNTGGVVRYYQAAYRNNGGPCGTGLNMTNGVSVVWQP